VNKLKILTILGSTREGRFGDKPAHWIHGRLCAHAEIDAELVDLRDWPLPFFDRASPMASTVSRSPTSGGARSARRMAS
jgi:NAD(P)H-dependent FMN reductase